MSRKFPQDTLEQAKVVASGWAKIDPDASLGELTLTGLQEQINAVSVIENQIRDQETELTNARNQRDEA